MVVALPPLRINLTAAEGHMYRAVLQPLCSVLGGYQLFMWFHETITGRIAFYGSTAVVVRIHVVWPTCPPHCNLLCIWEFNSFICFPTVHRRVLLLGAGNGLSIVCIDYNRLSHPHLFPFTKSQHHAAVVNSYIQENRTVCAANPLFPGAYATVFVIAKAEETVCTCTRNLTLL